ncbi:MAG: hypothetical protein AMJ79_04955 [Phycisphaerae bacterium SM23_30]|nr:MAG: hypothetical protein AMJ79_04955 [Phycisphaerae bacterium SM23_30]
MTYKNIDNIILFNRRFLLPLYLFFFLLAGCQPQNSDPIFKTSPMQGKKVTLGPQTALIDPETAQILKANSLHPAARIEPSSQNADSQKNADQTDDLESSDKQTELSHIIPLSLTNKTADNDIHESRAEQKPPLNQSETVIPSRQTTLDTTRQELIDPAPVDFPALLDPNLANTPISVNFKDADVVFFIKTISDITGINFIVDDNIKGPITVLSPSEIRLGQLFRFLESILEVKGFAAVPARDHVKIIPRAQAHKYNLHMRIGCDPAFIPLNDSVVTQLMPLKYADVAEISNLLKPRLGVGSQIATYPQTNAILVTDTSSNIHNIAKIIQQLDVLGAQQEREVIQLKYASAQILSRKITEIIEKNHPNSSPPRNPASNLRLPNTTQITPIERTNSLIVIANKQNMEFIKDLIHSLDIERPAGTDNMHVVYLRHAQAKPTADSLSQALTNLRNTQPNANQPPVNITPDESTNALIIQASPQDYQVIAGIIEKLDIEREQVLVELFIVEAGEETLLEIGIDWATLDQAVSDSVRFFGNTNFGIRVDAAQGNLEGLSVGAFKEVGGQVRIGSILSALEKESGVNILSKPHILTSNHQQAQIFVGDTIPFVVQNRIAEEAPTTQPIIQTIDYKDVGVTLNITPHVSQGGQVGLEIDSKFTQLIESVTGLSVETPTTSTRQIKTGISMPSGQTVVIGGLIRDDKITIEKKIPFLGDIPLIGTLFKFQRDRLQKTNLLLFITPYILSGQSDLSAAAALKQNELTTQPDKIKY